MSILMEDLLKEINTLSSRLDESQSDSNSTSEIGQQNTMGAPGIDSLQMRNKTRSRKRRGKKRRMDCHPELYSESESFCSDTSEEEAIRDYIANVTTAAISSSTARPTMSDTDEDFVPRRRAVNLLNGVPWSPLEVGESDSFSENIMSLSSRKKRKIKKMNKKLEALESLEQIGIPDRESNVRERIGLLRRQLEENQNKKFKKRKQKSMKNGKIDNMDTDHTETITMPGQRMAHEDCDDDDDDMMRSNDVSSEEFSSDGSEGESSGSNEADDEGEESCVEANIPAVIPYWQDENMHEDDEEKEFKLVLSQSFGLLSQDYQEDLQREIKKKSFIMPPPKLNDNGSFIVYANKRIKSFLQNGDENEIYLNAFNEYDQDQILEIAGLYSLCSKIEESPSKKRVILTKTKNSREPDGRVLKRFLKKESRKTRAVNAAPQRWGSKRRKVTSITPEVYGTENACAIPETNVGNQMLRNMGWKPGSGLGKEGNGIIKPVTAYKRPKKLGLGYPT